MTEQLVQQAQQVHKDQQEMMDWMALKVRQAQQAHKDLQD